MRKRTLVAAIVALAVGVAGLGLAQARSGGSATAGPTPAGAGELRITPAEFDFSDAGQGGTGTSGVAGIRTLKLKGDPDQPGLYTILLRIPPNTRIRAHTHPDERIATVVSGVWRLGYGESYDEAQFKALPAGSFYTEPAGRAHFAQTQDSEVLLMITGIGPSGLDYTEASP